MIQPFIMNMYSVIKNYVGSFNTFAASTLNVIGIVLIML
jgi:hypothetical protein